MEKFEKLSDAIERGIIREGSWISLEGVYADTNNEVEIPKTLTGYELTQKFNSSEEKYFGGIFVFDKNGIPTALQWTTVQQLGLFGMTGYENGPKAVEICCSVFNRDDIGVKARAMKVDDVQFFNKEGMHSDLLKICTNDAWLANHCDEPFEKVGFRDHTFGMFVLDERHGILYKKWLAAWQMPNHYKELGVHPMISLDSDKLFVNTESEEENYWQITV